MGRVAELSVKRTSTYYTTFPARMWQLPVYFLLVALASAEKLGYNYPEPQNGYLPPSPSNPGSVVCQPAVTSVSYINQIQTSVSLRTVNQVNTQFLTTTVFKREVVPTTLYQTRVQTQVQYQTSVVQNTQVQYRDRVIQQNIPGPNIVRTQYTTLTRVVPEVSYVTRENVRTQVVPVEITRTAVQTIERTNVQYNTQNREQTYVVTLPAQEVVRAQVQNVVQTSIVKRQEPAQTRIISSTRIQQVVNTRSIQAQDRIETRIVQKKEVVPTTIVSQRIDNSVVYRTNVFTKTNVRTQTSVRTQIVPQNIVSTRLVPTTVYSTRLQKVAQPVTRVETRIVTQTVAANPVVQTRQVTQTSVVQVRGQNRLINREVLQTRQQQQIIYQTVNRVQEITVTQTITATCGKSGYNYDAPAKPFNF